MPFLDLTCSWSYCPQCRVHASQLCLEACVACPWLLHHASLTLVYSEVVILYSSTSPQLFPCPCTPKLPFLCHCLSGQPHSVQVTSDSSLHPVTLLGSSLWGYFHSFPPKTMVSCVPASFSPGCEPHMCEAASAEFTRTPQMFQPDKDWGHAE
jgi:hypothetical protein